MTLAERLLKAAGQRGNLAKLSRASGLSHTALQKIMRGKTPNPGILTCERIENALREVAPEHSTPTPQAEVDR